MGHRDSRLEACLRGDQDAWKSFVEQFHPLVLRTARARLKRLGAGFGDADAEDVAQDVFLKLWADERRRLGMYDPAKGTVETWLAVTAARTALNYAQSRKLARSHELPLRTDGGEVPQLAGTIGQQIGEQLVSQEQAEQLQDALAELAAADRLLLALIYEQQMTQGQAGQVLGITEPAVTSRLRRLRARLKSALKKI